MSLLILGQDPNKTFREVQTDTAGRLLTSSQSAQLTDENGATLTVKRAKADVAASQTDSAVVAAVASKKIRVLSLFCECGGTATDLTFNTKPAGGGTAISCKFANGVNGGAVLPHNPNGWFETSAGEGLSATTGAGSATGILVTYVEV